MTGEAVGFASEELRFAGASRDLTHSVFSIEAAPPSELLQYHGHRNTWPGDTTKPGSSSLYEYVYAGAPNPEPILVGVRNQASLKHDAEAELISSCGTYLGSGTSTYNAVSKDGETVFFTASACGSSPAVNELYARVGGARTVAVSEPSREDCQACNTTTGLADATFQGASQNGEKVFFLTEQALFAGQEGMNLYEYDANAPMADVGHPTGRIALVSGGSGAPEVQGVVRVSEDGSHVYFVAKGVLTAGRNAEGNEPEQGAENLYVYNTVTGARAFVAKLLTGAEEASIGAAESLEESRTEEGVGANLAQEAVVKSEQEHGEITVSREEELLGEAVEAYEAFINTTRGTVGPSGTLEEDRSVWGLSDSRPAQATPEGRFLVFPSSADLTVGDESRLVPQLFEYDANEERLTRVSIGQGGTYNSDGNVATFQDAPQLPRQSFEGADLPTAAESGSALSSDGSSVFFTSAAGLTPQAVRNDRTVYEYREGAVYLISDGRDASVYNGSPTVQLFGVDPSGEDALFLSADQLVPQDGETQMVLYDARAEGGFPAPVLAAGCVGETCRGPAGASPQQSLPGSTGQAGAGNLAPPPAAKHALTPKPRSLSQARKLAKALRVCARKHGRQRATCAKRARKRYARASRATANRGGK